MYMKVIKTYETTRIMVKISVFTLFAILVLTGILPTNSADVGISIF